MKQQNTDLSSRYYTAERTMWLWGCILLVTSIFGAKPYEAIKQLKGVQPETIPKILACLIIANGIYLVFEWRLSSKQARERIGNIIRATITTTFTVVVLWLSTGLITKNTIYEGISPAWYLGFTVIGYLIGLLLSILMISYLSMLSKEEAKDSPLPRMSVAARCQFIVGVPGIVILLGVYALLLWFAPQAIHNVSYILISIPILGHIVAEIVSLHFSYDENGNKIPYATRIANLKAIFNNHHYSYMLNGHLPGFQDMPGFEDMRNIPREEIQDRIHQMINDVPSEFKVQTMVEFSVRPYAKDGNVENDTMDNRGMRLMLKDDSKEIPSVIHFEGSEGENIEVSLPVESIEKHMDEYLSTHSEKNDLLVNKILSYGLEQTALAYMQDEAQNATPSLPDVAMAGDIDMIKELVEQDVDINEKNPLGWTGLLGATAQGHIDIVKILLKAGANPDIGNLKGITPLMYGASYGFTDICKLLLEYGADPNVQDMSRETALFPAVGRGELPIVKLLIEEGVDVSIKSLDGKTALDEAYARKQGDIAKVLRKAAKHTV